MASQPLPPFGFDPRTIPAGIFREYDIRGVVGADLTASVAYGVGRAYAAYLLEVRGLSAGAVAVGRDNRPSGAMLREALVEGLLDGGCSVLDLGEVPTPAMYWACHHLRVVGGIQITGSHNPPEFNGFKLCVGTAALHGPAIAQLYQLATRPLAPAPHRGGYAQAPILERYVTDLVARTGPIATPGGRRLKVVVDAGNGAGALVVESLLSRFDVDVTYLYCDSDGTFPNHHPDPTVAAHLADLIAAVRATGADLGIAYDGDADRIGVVDHAGTIRWGDQLLLLYARDLLARSTAGVPIIFDVKCSAALADGIRAAGGVPVMWKTGHSLIKEKMLETGAPIAGEMSGHMFFADGFYGHDDALYATTRLLRLVAASGRSVADLLADLPPTVVTPELRVDCPDAAKAALVAAVRTHFTRVLGAERVATIDGARLEFPDGWGLVRASNTQPILVLRFEGRTVAAVQAMQDAVAAVLGAAGLAVHLPRVA